MVDKVDRERRERTIEAIKRQPFFLPRVPHPYEGVQWVGIDPGSPEGDQTAVAAFEFNRIDLWSGATVGSLWRSIRKDAAIKRIMAQPFFHSPRRRWTPEEIAEYERGHKERTRKALERIEARRRWRP